MIYGMQGKYDTSIQYLETAIGIAERNGYNDKLAGDYGNIALGYQMRSDFSRALLYQQKALDLAKANNDIPRQASLILNMGATYNNIGDTARAEQAYLQAVNIGKSNGIKDVELYGYSNLAGIYSKKKQPEKSYDYAMKTAMLGNETGDHGSTGCEFIKSRHISYGYEKI